MNEKKRREHYPLIICLFLSALFFTVVSVIGQRSVLRAYEYDYADAPLLSLTFRALADGVTPAELLQAFRTPAEEAPSHGQNDASVQISAPAEEPAPAQDPVSYRPELPPAEDHVSYRPELPPAEDHVSYRPDPSDYAEPSDTPPPAATGAPAEDTYYADALFIGDSRTVGLSQYVPGLDAEASFYCKTSMSVFNALDLRCAPVDGESLTIEEALERQHFGKIYLMLGINEIGYDMTQYLEAYEHILNRIRYLQPDATIYVQGIMHVSEKKQREQPVFSNAAVNERNERLKLLCDGEKTIYIDINYLLDDETGSLSAEHTFDGVHLTAGSYDLWYQMIKAQTR